MPNFDVVVVGGGPAGAVSALKCSELGLNVLLMERETSARHKPCGGILPPICADLVLETVGTGIPQNVMCSPNTLGLYYVPPSGRKNSGSVKRRKSPINF
jgi:flavin-dependent dehydrogenase